ncbi:unnamed protein product [Caenorhabditis bovis]|uniref:DNA topoisomerase (ATP-hydrolyzing) n=1 Tax=Caenorhabditis bovis TaxID=2654633 RepID=A0A8S1EQC0_9PELO|nr:unnamed protein product [Caenorhabditis bovis]
MSLREFVDGDLARFGLLDLRRSIPCLVDGLKPSQRKVLWTMLRMDENREIKVSQLAGAVAHSQAYHHGEESLVRTIVRMGQSFCGASNLPLLQPIGQFGTRHEGGHDAASARYIFTALSPTTRLIFPQQDDALLDRRIEDGIVVEPEWLCPIIPMILVNGAEGIGTGWSTRIVGRRPTAIIAMVRNLIEGKNCEASPPPPPYFNEFDGRIEATPHRANRFVTTGRVRLARGERKNATNLRVDITELPIGVATSKYKEKLNRIVAQFHGDFTEHHTEKRVHFRVSLDRRMASKLANATTSQLLDAFKLTSSMAENLVVFDEGGRLREFDTPMQIALEHFMVRRRVYEQRLRRLASECGEKLRVLENQIRFVDMVSKRKIEVQNVSRHDLEEQLRQFEFFEQQNGTFNYLLEMPIARLTVDECSRLEARRRKRVDELDELSRLDWQTCWWRELDELERRLNAQNK